jgi:hypothetical protein
MLTGSLPLRSIKSKTDILIFKLVEQQFFRGAKVHYISETTKEKENNQLKTMLSLPFLVPLQAEIATKTNT